MESEVNHNFFDDIMVREDQEYSNSIITNLSVSNRSKSNKHDNRTILEESTELVDLSETLPHTTVTSSELNQEDIDTEAEKYRHQSKKTLKKRLTIFVCGCHIVMVLFIITICMLLIDIANAAKSTPGSETDVNEIASETRYKKHIRDNIALIHSEEELIKIATTTYPDTINISLLTTPLPEPPPPLPRLAKRVTQLNIIGEISESWLLHLAKTFHDLLKLQISIDGLCLGSSTKDRSKLQPIVANKLMHLVLEENNLCPLISWIFLSDFDHLESLRLRKVHLNKKNYKGFTQFLDRHKKTIKYIRLEDCALCDDCDLSQVPVELREKVKIV